LEKLLTRAIEIGQSVVDYLSQGTILFQLGLVAGLFVAGLIASRRVEPVLEGPVSRLQGYPGFFRVVSALRLRVEWVFFAGLLTLALFLMRSIGWPESTTLTSNALVLALAWLAISVLSYTIRNRVIGRVIAVVGWSYVALVVLGFDDDAAAVLDAAGFSVGSTRISALLLLKALLLLGALLWFAVTAGNVLDSRVQGYEDLTPSLRVLIGKLVKFGLIVVATAVALAAVGIDLTVFTVFSGAIGLGIGFGLQKVVSNFISGIIILMDQSIKPGDTITLGETFGWIRELRARFVSVVTRDGREYLIPNEDFITREVINWSFSDDLVRLDVNFGVSYDSDPHQVTALAIAAAGSVSRVVTSRPPVCWLTRFGDSSLDFVLRFWIRDPRNGLTNVRGQVLMALWDSFKANGVAIPYPHRDVFIRGERPRG